MSQEKIAEWRGASEGYVADAVNRIEHVDRGHATEGEDLIVVDPIVFQIEAEQHRVLHRTGIETILQLVVQIALVGGVFRVPIVAANVAGSDVGIAVADQAAIGEVNVRVSGILPECDAVGQVALELIADHLLFALERIDAGVANEQFRRDAPKRCVDHRSDIGKEVNAARIRLRS